MALRNTAPLHGKPLVNRLNLLTRTGASLIRTVPFGGAVGIVAAGVFLWLAPERVPPGWSAQAVITLGMAAGVVLHRVIDAVSGWLVEPGERHLRATWNAWIGLAKIERYRRRGILSAEEAQQLAGKIARDDVAASVAARRKSR
jgi:hypothetical protein